MSDYFDQVEQHLRDAVRRRAHVPWYVRVRGISRTRALVVVLAALVVATPAIGAVTNWYGFGKPDYFRQNSPMVDAGRALPGTSELLPLRVPDPQGGPPWGLRLVHTTRGDTCIQLGRVEGGRLGSLGIDDAWNNDHQFHPFPNTSEGQDCGTTDAAGDGFVNVAYSGAEANANPTAYAHGPQSKSCQPVEYTPSRLAARRRGRSLPTQQNPQGLQLCPKDSNRFVFMGLLGPDAQSITYETPQKTLKTIHTSGSDGAYLLVFPLTQATCNLYAQGPRGGYAPCGGTESQGGASPDSIGAIKAIRYRDGDTCHLTPSTSLETELVAYARSIHLSRHRGRPLSQRQIAQLHRLELRFMAAHHLTLATFRDEMSGQCPAVGYVAPNEKHLTQVDVASPVHVKVIPNTKRGPEFVISFIARQPVTSSDSWYEFATSGPRSCEAGGAGQIGFGNIHVGQRLTESDSVGAGCKGVIRGVVGYMQNGGPINQNNSGGGTPGQDGSIVVGRFSFRLR